MAHWVPPQFRDRFQRPCFNRMKRPNIRELRLDVLQLLENYRNGIPLGEFGQYFMDFFGYMVDPSYYGFHFWIDMLQWFGNPVTVRKLYGDLIVKLNNGDDQSEMESSHDDENHETGSFSSMFPLEMKEIFFQILSRHNNGLWDSLLLSEFRKATGRNLDMRPWHMYDVRELISSLPDVFNVVQCQQTGDYMLFNAQKSLGQQNEPPTSRNLQESGVSFLPREIKTNIRDVILERRGGILLPDFVTRYEQKYHEHLQPSRYGLDSVEHMLESMRDCIEMIFLDDERVLLKVISPDETENNSQINLEDHMQTDVDEPDALDFDMRTLDEKLNRSRCANDAAPPAFQIPKQTLPFGHDIRKYMAVYVSYITSPSVFWFQLRGKSTSLQLDNLMDEINNFYSNEGGELYSVPPERVTNKQVLAVRDPEDEHWYRAVITATEGASAEVEVNFIDYGSRCKVSPSELRLLRNIYCDLPAQALEAELAFISPIEGHVWTPTATEKFKELTNNGCAIMALINEKKSNTYSLCLCDTTSDADVHINDVLVKEGYAKLQEKPQQSLNFALQPVGQENHRRVRSPPMITVSDDDNDEDDDVVVLEGVHVRTTYLDSSNEGYETKYNVDLNALKHETISICGSSSNEGRISPQVKQEPWSTWR